MRRPRMIELVGILLYLGGLFALGLLPVETLEPQRWGLLLAMVVASGLVSYRLGLGSVAYLGLILATGGLMWQMAVLRFTPAHAANTLVLTGLLCLVGIMLMGRAQLLSPRITTISGWGSVVVLWLSTRFPGGNYMLLVPGIAILALHFHSEIKSTTPA